jgi:hypothetical protein
MITLKYTINGSKFKRTFAREEHAAARIRATVLRENGITVKVAGFPQIVHIKVPQL